MVPLLLIQLSSGAAGAVLVHNLGTVIITQQAQATVTITQVVSATVGVG